MNDVAVIERPLNTLAKCYLHRSSLDEISDDFHEIEELTLRRASDESSLSTYLLGQIGLGRRGLRQAPTKDDSAVDRLSFRDLADLYYLPHRRLDNLELVHERHPPKRIKLRQTVDVIFGAHDDALVDASSELESVQDEIEQLSEDIDAIAAFLDEEGISAEADLGRDERQAEAALRDAVDALGELEASMATETASADELRALYSSASNDVLSNAALVRDRETLLNRLGALRAQYADDLLKLRFAAEASRLFDPLSLVMCPSCLQPLTAPPGPSEGSCGLCSQSVAELERTSAFDVSKEIRTTETKLRELEISMNDIEEEHSKLMKLLDEATRIRDRARRELNVAVSARLAPFVAQRDLIRDRISELEQNIEQIQMARSLLARLDRRRAGLAQLRADEERIKARIAQLRAQGQDHERVVSSLSDRFGSILADFKFPKLSSPRIDSSLIPHVRGMRYSGAG